MRKIISICFLFLSFNMFAQQRIGIDLNTRGLNLNTSIHYQKVFKHNFLYSIGIFGGNFGESGINLTKEQFDAGQRVYSPFDKLNQPFIDTINNSYTLMDYGTKGKGYGLQLGIGYFYEFSIIHGIRFNLNNRIAYMKNTQSTLYYSFTVNNGHTQIDHTNHFVGAISPEIYHTIRLSGKTTFYYGFKFPYFYSIDKGKFNPKYTKDLFNAWEPELSIGLTYVVGKCD